MCYCYQASQCQSQILAVQYTKQRKWHHIQILFQLVLILKVFKVIVTAVITFSIFILFHFFVKIWGEIELFLDRDMIVSKSFFLRCLDKTHFVNTILAVRAWYSNNIKINRLYGNLILYNCYELKILYSTKNTPSTKSVAGAKWKPYAFDLSLSKNFAILFAKMLLHYDHIICYFSFLGNGQYKYNAINLYSLFRYF